MRAAVQTVPGALAQLGSTYRAYAGTPAYGAEQPDIPEHWRHRTAQPRG
ncbi:MAG: hypothetical protein ACR2H2_16115 [Solirubrobacteraceae bacterium]